MRSPALLTVLPRAGTYRVRERLEVNNVCELPHANAIARTMHVRNAVSSERVCVIVVRPGAWPKGCTMMMEIESQSQKNKNKNIDFVVPVLVWSSDIKSPLYFDLMVGIRALTDALYMPQTTQQY